MATKLTLSIKKEIIEEAKDYAQKEGRSLSNIVEEYLKSVSTKKVVKKKTKLSPIVKELSGSVKLPDNKEDYKKLLQNALVDKYLSK